MKKIAVVAILICMWTIPAVADDGAQDPRQLFYKANSLYEKRDYEKASEEYAKILAMGLETGPLYYNIGNTFYKMGKIGYAILAYKRALRLMPGDSDLKSNLNYAQSLTEDSALSAQGQNRIALLIKAPFRDMNLNTVAIILITLYLMVIMLAMGGIINHIFRQRVTFIFYLSLVLFLITLAAFSVKYYDEEVLRHGIVVTKEAECKYEPIDKSTTYYTLKEGQEVLVLKTRNGWRRIRRLDGKLGWVKSDAVEEID